MQRRTTTPSNTEKGADCDRSSRDSSLAPSLFSFLRGSLSSKRVEVGQEGIPYYLLFVLREKIIALLLAGASQGCSSVGIWPRSKTRKHLASRITFLELGWIRDLGGTVDTCHRNPRGQGLQERELIIAPLHVNSFPPRDKYLVVLSFKPCRVLFEKGAEYHGSKRKKGNGRGTKLPSFPSFPD